MAAIYLDNLVKPSLFNNKSVKLEDSPKPNQYTYTDLHLDLEFATDVGNGNVVGIGKDLKVDNDIYAIRNSIHNILLTRPGCKILNPTLGSSLEQHLFEPISLVRAKIIGKIINETLVQYEPRIEVLQTSVNADVDDNTYYISLKYKIKENLLIDTLEIQLKNRQSAIGATTINYQSLNSYV